MKVIAIDPGGTTGWSTYSAVVMPDGTHHEIRWNQGYFGPDEHHKVLHQWLEMEVSDQDTHIVYESFEYRQRERDNVILVSKEYIGIIKLVADDFSRQVTLVSQTASMALPPGGFVTNQMLEIFDLLNTPVSKKPQKDINDAARHLIYYLVVKQHLSHLTKRLKEL